MADLITNRILPTGMIVSSEKGHASIDCVRYDFYGLNYPRPSMVIVQSFINYVISPVDIEGKHPTETGAYQIYRTPYVPNTDGCISWVNL